MFFGTVRIDDYGGAVQSGGGGEIALGYCELQYKCHFSLKFLLKMQR